MTDATDTTKPRVGGQHWSFSQFSDETGRTRETIRRKVANAGLQPSGYVGSNPIYRVKDVLPLLYSADDHGNIDPEKLEPHSKLSHFRAEKEKMILAEKARDLIPRAEYRIELAAVLKQVSQTFDIIPDILERDCALAPSAVERVQAVCDDIRNNLAEKLSSNSEEPAQPENPEAEVLALFGGE